MLSPILRRLYSTKPGPMAPGALVARTTSTPMAVRIRRFEQSKKRLVLGETDATPEGLSPSQHARFLRLQGLGKLKSTDTPEAWLARENVKRTRIRGTRTVMADGQKTVDVVGQAIYLPNIKFTLVRNHTLSDEPYNPWEATFHVPPSITKTDIRSYLKAAYGVDSTYIRTEIHRPKMPKRGKGFKGISYKRAVVGLVEPFYYPNRFRDMSEQERKDYDAFLEEHWRLKETKQEREKTLDNHLTKDPYGPRGRAKILANITARRAERERVVAETVSGWQAKRANNEPITLLPEALPKPPVTPDDAESTTSR